MKATGLPYETIRNEIRAGHLRMIRKVEHRGFKQTMRFAKDDVERWLARRLERQAGRWV
jgi:hypothetical protein